MRSRNLIQDSYKEITVPAGSEQIYRLAFEILLDIRDLLIDEKGSRLRRAIEKETRLIEQKKYFNVRGE